GEAGGSRDDQSSGRGLRLWRHRRAAKPLTPSAPSSWAVNAVTGFGDNGDNMRRFSPQSVTIVPYARETENNRMLSLSCFSPLSTCFPLFLCRKVSRDNGDSDTSEVLLKEVQSTTGAAATARGRSLAACAMFQGGLVQMHYVT